MIRNKIVAICVDKNHLQSAIWQAQMSEKALYPVPLSLLCWSGFNIFLFYSVQIYKILGLLERLVSLYYKKSEQTKVNDKGLIMGETFNTRIIEFLNNAYLTPIVACGISKERAISIKSGSRDRTSNIGKSFEPLLRIFIPEIKCTITASSRECAMQGMEWDCIHCIYIIAISVAFEREAWSWIMKNIN